MSKKLFEFASLSADTSTKPIAKKENSFKVGMKKFTSSPGSIFGVIILIILIICAITFSEFSDPFTRNLSNKHSLGTSSHWFGTDEYGRDLWARNWWGLRFSLVLALIVSTINVMIGTLIGIVTGYFNKVDGVFKWIIKILYSIPSILILILFTVVFRPSFAVMIFALITTGWVNCSQQVRSQTLRIRSKDYVTASQTLGTTRLKVFGLFFLNAIPAIITQFVIMFPRVILAEAVIGFLGLSIPDYPTLGNVINKARGFITFSPHEILIPTTILISLTASIQLIGYGVENVFESKGGS